MTLNFQDEAIVYHIQDPAVLGDIDHGYVGVVLASKGAELRFREHRKYNSNLRYRLRENSVTFEHVREVFRGTLTECYSKENDLRPRQLMGWNLATGGGGPYHGIKKLGAYRSRQQQARMTDVELKARQAEKFKENYYSDPYSQKLRKRRAVEHMAKLEQRQACLGAMHKKVICPHCGYENNSGNVALHIKRSHQ